MANDRRIMLFGMTKQAPAYEHFRKAGHRVILAQEPRNETTLTENPEADIVYLQASHSVHAINELRLVLKSQRRIPVVLICDQCSVQMTMEAWRAGASDILFSPLTPESLDESLKRAMMQAHAQTQAGDEEIQARFRFLDGNGKECWAEIAPPKFTIGRSTGNNMVLGNQAVSRAQAEVLIQNGEYILRDLNSKHGTFVNGVRIEQVALTHGDHIRMGGLQGEPLTFQKGDLLQSLLASSGSKADSGLTVHGFREMGKLLSTLHALSTIPLLDDLLNLVVDTAVELTGAERGFIMLKEADGTLGSRCARNAHKQPLDTASFQTSRRVPEEVFQTTKRIVINDLDLDDESQSHTSTRRLGVRSICCVPLCYLPFRDSPGMSGIMTIETIGVLYVDSPNIGGGLSPAQIEAFDTLASEAAMAISQARLYKESREKQKLEEDLRTAREIQQALLPPAEKVLPFVSACSMNLPCREVGGDYFDYFDLEEGRLGFALGDVAGKGMPAAILASMLQGIFCAQTLLNLPLPSMISNVNCSLARRGTGSRFVTFFFGILDADGNCTYTNAGHNPPILVRKDGTMRFLTEGGMVLGLFPQAQYETQTVKMEPGDHVILFTDGVAEALNTKGEEFGDQRIRDLVKKQCRSKTQMILQCLKDELAAFSANTPQQDDITMMVIGYCETD